MFSKAECITMKIGGALDAASRKDAADVLRRQRGVRTVTIDVSAVATVTYRPDQTDVETLTDALAHAGYSLI